MYAVLLVLHSYLRWAVLGLAVAGLVRAFSGFRAGRGWVAADERLAKLTLASIDTQLLLGLALYFVSPVVSTARQNMAAAMHDRTLRFFSVEHLSMMLLAVAVAHIGRVRAKKHGEAPARHKTTLLTLVGFLVLVAASIPWPFLPHGRPLLRGLL